MNKFKIIVLLTFCFNFTLIADDFAIKADMGTMMFFYRYQPILTEWIHQTPDNIKMPVPAFMTDKNEFISLS
jgi:hypothetical protein